VSGLGEHTLNAYVLITAEGVDVFVVVDDEDVVVTGLVTVLMAVLVAIDVLIDVLVAMLVAVLVTVSVAVLVTGGADDGFSTTKPKAATTTRTTATAVAMTLPIPWLVRAETMDESLSENATLFKQTMVRRP
jgi:hypothetical protein